MHNEGLNSLKTEVIDEFYTKLHDIELELKHYQDKFSDKVVYCNCDDYEKSNFFKYFKDNFKNLGLKELVATCYDNGEGAKIARYDGVNLSSGFLKGNGSFDSVECLEILKTCDTIVTNPPFSLLKRFIPLLHKHNKEFLIIANILCLGYKENFPYIQDNLMWLGHHVNDFTFIVPDNHTRGNVYTGTNGVRYSKVSNICWVTNLDNKRRYIPLYLKSKYSERLYPKYDNRDAIDVNSFRGIPRDYYGEIGVPLSFLAHYNPEQFEITGFRKGDNNKDLTINGKPIFTRVLIKRKVK